MPALMDSPWTVDMVDALPSDGQRYELVDGELHVTPSPSDDHQFAVGEMFLRLASYLTGSRAARAVVSPSDVRRGDKTRNRLQPDVYVLKLPDGKRPAYPFELKDLLLAVEVESPSNSRLDYQVKRPLYVGAGIEYWIVSHHARTISRWRGAGDAGEVLSAQIEWAAPGSSAPLVIDVQEFFDTALR